MLEHARAVVTQLCQATSALRRMSPFTKRFHARLRACASLTRSLSVRVRRFRHAIFLCTAVRRSGSCAGLCPVNRGRGGRLRRDWGGAEEVAPFSPEKWCTDGDSTPSGGAGDGEPIARG